MRKKRNEKRSRRATSEKSAAQVGYDNAGNTLSGEGATYTYSPFNRLATVSKAGVVTTYSVNALGQRVYKKTGAGTGQWFSYGLSGELLGEHQSGAWTQYARLPDGTPIARIRGGQISHIHTDHLGRPEMVTNSAKATVWRASNHAFDRTVTLDTIGGLNLGLPGQYFDQETGNWYNYHRTYNPRTGRYLESDPIGLAGGLNTYAYVGGNPVGAIDPLGLIDLKMPGVSVSIHANPGPEATTFRAEHDPPHIHLGSNDGLRVSTEDFKPLSEKDARRMTKEQVWMCQSLSSTQKSLVRGRQAAVFRYGRYMLKVMSMPLVGADSLTIQLHVRKLLKQ